jgi:hypothetical protein
MFLMNANGVYNSNTAVCIVFVTSNGHLIKGYQMSVQIVLAGDSKLVYIIVLIVLPLI